MSTSRVRRIRKEISDALLDLWRFVLLVTGCLRLGVFPGAHWVPFAGYRRLSFAVRFRRLLESLGLTYLKLGQFLALRFDVLPRAVCDELNQLFESVPPMPPAVSRAILEEELGGNLNTLFLEFEPEPIAAASIAQVHRAKLHDGQVVAVKIQRAGLEPIFNADIRNLIRAARLVDAMGLFGRLSAQSMVGEFANWTLRELDFRLEGDTAERIAQKSDDFVVIPRVMWRLSTRKILTMDFVEGVSISHLSHVLEQGGKELAQQQYPGLDLDLSMERFADASLSQLFTHGFFHGDPHPGNILFRKDNRVAFLDFGIFGSLSPAERESVAGQIEHLAMGDITGSFEYYSRQLLPTDDTDYEQFRIEALEVLRRWHETAMNPRSSIQERHLAKYTAEMIDVSRRHHLRYGMNYLLFWRALNHLNATLWLLAPDYDLMSQLRDFFRRIRPGWMERAQTTLLEEHTKSGWAELLPRFPPELDGCLAELAAGDGRPAIAVVETAAARRDRRGGISRRLLAVLALPVVVVVGAPSAPLATRLILCAVFLAGVFTARSLGKQAR